MEQFERTILRWICLFDDFKSIEYANAKNLVSGVSFKKFVDDVFCRKCSTPLITEDEKLFNTIKVNYEEFEVDNYEYLYDNDNTVYTCVVVLLHALLKCTDNKFRDQLSERMDSEEQVLLATFLEATQLSLLTKQNISEALMMVTNDKKLSSANVSETFSNSITPIKSKSMRRSYLQEFCESPKTQSLLYQEKEKLIAKLTEDYKNECEENYKLAENIKMLNELNLKLSNKVEDKDKIIQFLKDEIEEISKPKESSDVIKVDNTLMIKKLNQDILDLELSNSDLKHQLKELENKHKDLNTKFEKESSNYENLLLTFDNVEAENMSLKENEGLLKMELQKKETEITSLKDELCNKSLSNCPINTSGQGTNLASSNTLFDELSCVKLEEVTHDKEKYRHKYKSVKKDLLNTETHVKDLDEQISALKQQLQDCESHKDKLHNKFSDKKKELLECQKKNNNLETKIKHLKDTIKDKENVIESVCTKLDKKENQLKELLVEIDSIKKSKTMIELILSKTHSEIEALHEEHNKSIKDFLVTIESNKKSEELLHLNITNLENHLKQIQEDLASKESIIIFYEEKTAENYQTVGIQEEQLRTLYQEKITLETHLKNVKMEAETLEKKSSNKIRELENILEYHLDEVKDGKTKISKLEEILGCKQNEIEQQNKLITYQKNITEVLQSEKSNLEISHNNLSKMIKLKISENDFLTKNLNQTILTTKNMQEDFDSQLKNIKTNLYSNDNKMCTQVEKLSKLKDYLLIKINECETQIDINNKQKENISNLETDKCDLLEKLKLVDKLLLKKDTEITNLEKELQSRCSVVIELEEQLGVMRIEKVMIETNLNETAEQIKSLQEQFTKQINEISSELNDRNEEIIKLKNQSTKTENLLKKTQNKFDKQVGLTRKQEVLVEKIKSEKDILQEQVVNANKHLTNTEVEIESLKERLNTYESLVTNLTNELGVKETEKNVLENSLKETINEKKVNNQLFDEQIKELKNCLKNTSDENSDLKIHLTELKNDSNKNLLQFEHENNELKSVVHNTERQVVNLQAELSTMNDCILKKEDDIISLKSQNSEYSTENENLVKQVLEVRLELNEKQVKLDNQIQLCKEQEEIILKTNVEKESMCKQVKNLEDALSHKEYEFNLCEGKLYDCSNSMINLEKMLDEVKKEKLSLEMKLNEKVTELTNKSQDLLLQLEIKGKQIVDIQEKLINEQNVLHKHIENANEQLKTIALLNTEKETIEDKYRRLQECLNEKECSWNIIKEQSNNYEKQNEELQTLIINLESKLDEVNCQLNKTQIELEDSVCKYNYQVEKVVLLTTERDNLANEIDVFKNTLLARDSVIDSNQEKLLEYEELNDKIKTEKATLEIELKKNSEQYEITCQKLTQQLEEMKKKLHNVEENLTREHVDLESQIKITGDHLAVISDLTSDKDNLINETNALKDCLLERENTLASNHLTLKHLKTQLEELHTQKTSLESELIAVKAQFTCSQDDLIQKLKTSNDELKETHEQLITLQRDLDIQSKCANKQEETIGALTSERNNLIAETNRLKDCLTLKENTLTSNQNKFDQQNEEVNCLKSSLLELNDLKCQINSLRQDSMKQISEMDEKLCKTHEQLSQKQLAFKKQIELKNTSLADIYNKISDLKNIRDDLKLVLKKERTDFETCLESCSNYSPSYVNHKPILHHEDSLMEVITSADTFIEQNGIQIAPVENADDYSIIERLKKLFEALKMFIININTQGNEQAIMHTNTEYEFNEQYAELIATSNKQLETIKHLEDEMSNLKAECNYKMTKVQQKTQEYVTSEYEKKFQRKREQMKQFCKDLETKMHQDYDTKLTKYKEKINKDEAHIKELGHQLWEVRDKYLRLQHQNRRESTLSLPHEISISHTATTNIPKFDSFTLPKSSSSGQLRSLIEENNRAYQEHSKRNVPVGIGKKFSLSSGKIFPKEEDEEGEMFNHSCLSDLKQGKVNLNETYHKQFNERLSELQARNSLCPPHLRSSYAVETNYLPTSTTLVEEDIKAIINYSDCESENLIPNDRNKKKDRNQTSYKKPGPPTPSKNGGRSSLSGNTKIALKESKETNTNKRRTSSTPNKLFSLFMSKKN